MGLLQCSPIVYAKLFCNGVLESLAGLEDGNTGSGDLDGFLGLGVAAHAGITALELKGAKANELNLVALLDSIGNGFHNGGQSLFSVLLGQAGLAGDLSNEFGLVHNSTSFSNFIIICIGKASGFVPTFLITYKIYHKFLNYASKKLGNLK